MGRLSFGPGRGVSEGAYPMDAAAQPAAPTPGRRSVDGRLVAVLGVPRETNAHVMDGTCRGVEQVSLISIYLTESVTITPRGDLSKYGVYDYTGTDVVTVARVKDKAGIRRGGTSDEIVYAKEMWLKAGESVSLMDRITHNSIVHEVVDMVTPKDIQGAASHIKVWVKLT